MNEYREFSFTYGYDAWKLASPYDEFPDEECFHEDYEADFYGRATCSRCGQTWLLTDEQIAAERAHQAAYDEFCRKEERRQRWDRFLGPWRRALRRIFMLFSPRRATRLLRDDEIPF